MSIKRRIEVMEKILESGSLSVIPKQERVVWAEGYTQEEREIQMAKKVAELHTRYGDFNEDCLFKVYIRLFGAGRATTDACAERAIANKLAARPGLLS